VIDVTVLLVSYNTREMTLAAIKSVYAQTKRRSFEIIVVDNGSRDGSAEAITRAYPGVKLMRRPDNRGFAAGNNLGAREARGTYLLLLNPDTEVLNGAIDNLVDFAERRSDGGAWGGVCVLGDGRIDPGCRQMEPTLIGRFGSLIGLDGRRVAKLSRDEQFNGVVPVLEGAFMMLRRDLWQQLGGFDETFVMYGEEADLCRRVRDAGYAIYMTGAARIRHFSGASATDSSRRTLQKTRGLMHYFRKHYGRAGTVAAGAAIWLHAMQRWVGGLVLTSLGRASGRRLRDRFGQIAMRPWLWWGGWHGQAFLAEVTSQSRPTKNR